MRSYKYQARSQVSLVSKNPDIQATETTAHSRHVHCELFHPTWTEMGMAPLFGRMSGIGKVTHWMRNNNE